MFKRNQTSHLNVRFGKFQAQSHRYQEFVTKRQEDTISLSGWSISDKQQNFILKINNKLQKKPIRIPKERFCSHLMKRNSMLHQRANDNFKENNILQDSKSKAKNKSQLSMRRRNLLKPVNFDFERVQKRQQEETPFKNLKYILSPNHINNLARVLKMIPSEQTKISFTSFVKSLEEEKKGLKILQDKNRNKAFTKYYPFL